ncbi:MAG: ATP-dependent DNA helicase [Phycisphaeraceae bacterium]|nr:MAG: ATP-dependent DNA helicase [Phycisphaeraceae bacterium]
MSHLRSAFHRQRTGPTTYTQPVTIDATTLLSAGGPVAERLGDAFEPRPEQVRMAQAVEAALASRGRLLVEAGTGVGKSFAYLAPAMLRVMGGKERVVIATNTIALQEQLIKKDAPVIRAALGVEPDDAALKIVLVKGRGNYISVRRLELASQKQDKLFYDEPSRRSLHAIEDWAYSTNDGTLATLPQLERPGVWDRVQSDSGNCMGRRCRNNKRCFYQNARREMEQANVLICNHALFFSDLALRERDVGFLPKYDHVILDEAHSAEDVASEHFGLSLTQGRVRHLLTTLHHQRTQRGFLPQLGVVSDGTALHDGVIHAVMDAGEAADEFFDSLSRIAPSGGAEPGAAATVRIREPGVVENPVTPVFRDLSLRLKRLREHVASEEDRYELNAYAERALAISQEAEVLVSQGLEGCAYWVERSRAGGEGPGRIAFACSPVEVGPLLRERLFESGPTVVLTSATLTTGVVGSDATDPDSESRAAGEAFAHICSRLGCDEAETLALGSPFDLASLIEVYIEDDMPDPRSNEYIGRLCERVREHVRATDGGAFVLFTSFALMRAAAERLAPAFDEWEIPLWVQGRDGPRGAILEGFCRDERSVLMGVASFWQGVDVRGHGLRNVIITRLPFEPPDRPLTEARLERIQQRGGNAFMEDSLPRAVIRFKQGIGRLVRSASDSGRVVVLDPRVVTKRYGRAFLRVLPEDVPVRLATRAD